MTQTESIEIESIYEKRDCRGMCLNSDINANKYKKNECGQCSGCAQNDCKTECDSLESKNITKTQNICGLNIEISDKKSESNALNSCGRCRHNDTTGCSCDL